MVTTTISETDKNVHSHWASSTGPLRHRLASVIPQEMLKELHRPQPVRHFLVLAWQFLLLALGGTGAWLFEPVYLWLPCSIVVGFTMFNFTVMLHEVVHEAVFSGRRARANRWHGGRRLRRTILGAATRRAHPRWSSRVRRSRPSRGSCR